MAARNDQPLGQQFWSALESVLGLRTVTAEWMARLGADYKDASTFLRPTDLLADSYPCQECACAHDVIHHGPDDIVTVCRCEPRECDTRPVARIDLVIYEVNRRALGEAVASALGAVPQHAPDPHLHMTWSIGTYSPRPGHPYPVHLTVQTEPDDLQQVVDALVARVGGPLVLAAPTRDLFRPQCEDTLRRVNAHFLSLAEEFALDPAGTISPRRPVDEILTPLVGAMLGSGAQEAAAGGGPGQPCLGLGPSEVRVVRAYQEWEARRGRRRGLPTLPRIDDLEDQTGLSRPTVIDARKALRRELILEQVPDARPGTLRLTTRGLRLQLPSDVSTVKPSVQ
jgi:hypothetical protein